MAVRPGATSLGYPGLRAGGWARHPRGGLGPQHAQRLKKVSINRLKLSQQSIPNSAFLNHGYGSGYGSYMSRRLHTCVDPIRYELYMSYI